MATPGPSATSLVLIVSLGVVIVPSKVPHLKQQPQLAQGIYLQRDLNREGSHSSQA